MSRPTLFIASRHPAVVAALGQYLDLFLPQGELTHRVELAGFSSPAELFERLDGLGPRQLRDAMVLLDLKAEHRAGWSVEDVGREHGLVAQLLLSYPEVYFVFLGSHDPDKPLEEGSPLRTLQQDVNSLEDDEDIKACLVGPATLDLAESLKVAAPYHFVLLGQLARVLDLIHLHARGFRTLFDATGLRSCLKYVLQGKVLGKLAKVRPYVYRPLSRSRLLHSAVSADEEASFLHLNGYVTYKFGFRTWLAYTTAEFERLLGDPSRPSGAAPSPVGAPRMFTTAVVDWHLAYRDDTGAEAAQPLVIRLNAFRDEKVQNPLVITSYREEVDHHKSTPWYGKTPVITKPYNGLFYFRQLAIGGKQNRVAGEFEQVLQHVERELARDKAEGQDNTLTPHSAPYACAVVAERLLARARRIKAEGPFDTETWIQVAVLAGEAKEVLGGLSRTMAYETVALQNEAEVHAELLFLGTTARLEVTQRLQSLEEEIGHLQQAGPGTRPPPPPARCTVQGCPCARRSNRTGSYPEASLNFLLQTVSSLRLQFTQHEQMEAAEECLRVAAGYEGDLQHLRRHPPNVGNGENREGPRQRSVDVWRNLYERYASYLDYATEAGTSVVKLVRLSLAWIVLFAALYFLLLALNDDPEWWVLDRIFLSTWHALLTFVELQPGVSDVEQFKMYQPRLQGFWGGVWINVYRIVLFWELAVAYTHLGLLVAILYRRITKRAP